MTFSILSRFDADIGWMFSARSKRCECKHMLNSHRPISGKCSLCGCGIFVQETSDYAKASTDSSTPSSASYRTLASHS